MFRPEYIIDDKVNWRCLSQNPNAIHSFVKLDISFMREKCKHFAEELAQYVFHPERLQRLSKLYYFDIEEYFDHI